jgi:hypothetical protein
VKRQHRVRRASARVISDESLDLYILACTAFIFSVFGVAGISSPADLASVILALLAVLALSQVRSRQHVSAIARAQRADPLSLFADAFPADLVERRAAASDLLLIGRTMSRTIQGSSREDMRHALERGARIRVLLLDPSNDELLTQTTAKHQAALSPQRLRSRILGTLDELISLRDTTNGELEIRVASFAPTAGINAIDSKTQNGLLVIQHYEHRPAQEAAPIIRILGKDGFWFHHFLAEAERMWEDGTPWPPGPSRALSRAPRPVFQEAFGTDLQRSMDQARDLLITGIARNTLLTSSYSRLESALRRGCQIRFLLVDPASDAALHFAADRNYAERSAGTLRERIEHSLRLLDELRHSTGGSLTVRLTAYPLATGVIAVDSTQAPPFDTSAAFVEYYTYRAPGEPKFVLTAADGHWYSNLLSEAEALWDNAADYSQSSVSASP